MEKSFYYSELCYVIDNNAWSQVSYRNINSAWRKLRPGCAPEREFERFETDAPDTDVYENAIAEEIISLGRSMGLEVDSKNVDDLVQDHITQLTTGRACIHSE